MHAPQSTEGLEELWGLAHPLTKLPRAGESSLHVRHAPAFNGDNHLAKGQLEAQFSLNTLGVLRELLEQTYRRTETADRIGIRRAPQRLLTRSPQIFDRLGYVIGAAVMTRQLVQMVIQLLRKHRLQRLSGALMQKLAALGQ